MTALPLPLRSPRITTNERRFTSERAPPYVDDPQRSIYILVASSRHLFISGERLLTGDPPIEAGGCFVRGTFPGTGTRRSHRVPGNFRNYLWQWKFRPPPGGNRYFAWRFLTFARTFPPNVTSGCWKCRSEGIEISLLACEARTRAIALCNHKTVVQAVPFTRRFYGDRSRTILFSFV